MSLSHDSCQTGGSSSRGNHTRALDCQTDLGMPSLLKQDSSGGSLKQRCNTNAALGPVISSTWTGVTTSVTAEQLCKQNTLKNKPCLDQHCHSIEQPPSATRFDTTCPLYITILPMQPNLPFHCGHHPNSPSYCRLTFAALLRYPWQSSPGYALPIRSHRCP